MPQPVISIENLSKSYQLGMISTGVFFRDVERWWAKKRGKPDPFLRVGEIDHGNRQGETIWALKDISLTVQQGEALGIIGRNGAGKSTLLKILSQVTAPTSGVVKVKGRIASLLEVGTGFHNELTGRENIYLNGAINGMTRAEVKRKFDEIVDFSGVEQFIDTPVKRYSSGMYVRLAFAVAAHLEPEILIVDEVLAVGDIEFQKKCLGKMGKVSQEGRTVLFVSHNLGMISRLCSKSVLLKNGHLSKFDNTSEVIRSYIETGIDRITERVKPHDPSKPISLRAVKICSEDGKLLIRPEIKYNEEFRIDVEYEVNKAIDNCIIWVALETTDGIMVFTTTDYDTDIEMLGNRIIGYYKATINIPGKWLNYGQYVIIVGIVKNMPLIVFDREETLTFSILEIDSPSATLQSATRRGVLQPILKWTTKKIR